MTQHQSYRAQALALTVLVVAALLLLSGCAPSRSYWGGVSQGVAVTLEGKR